MSGAATNTDSSPLLLAFLAVLAQAAGDGRTFRTEKLGERTTVVGADLPPFLLEEVLAPSVPAISSAWPELARTAATMGATPIVAIPRASRSLAEALSRDHVNWVDGAGNAHVRGPSLLLSLEGKTAPARLGLTTMVDPFAPKSSNLVRRLLVDQERSWRQKDLVHLAGLSQPQTSKVLRALERLQYVRRGGDGTIHVSDASALLDGWADAYRYRRSDIVPVHLTGDGMTLARAVDARLGQQGIDHWFTGLPAAWAYTEFARFRLVSVYVQGDPREVAAELKLRPSERGANLHLIGTGEQRLEIGQQRPHDLPCVHPLQVYLDLLGLPERAAEAAEQIRPLALGAIR